MTACAPRSAATRLDHPVRSIVLPISYHHPGSTRDSIAEAIDAGFRHVVLGLPAPYPEAAGRWVTSELVDKSA